MKCNYIEYHRLTDQMFSGVAQTDTHLNQYTEILRQYLINGGAANTMLKLDIGIQVTTKRFMLLQWRRMLIRLNVNMLSLMDRDMMLYV